MLVFVTGATGFVGRALLQQLSCKSWLSVRAAFRGKAIDFPLGVDAVQVGDLSSDSRWEEALSEVDVIIHAAGQAQVVKDASMDPLPEFRRVNVEGTLNFARQAAAANVKRFIFISSIKVNGGATILCKPFTTDNQPCPTDPYGISKWEAEIGLRELAKETGMEMVFIRPPLIYGPGVKANFLSIMFWVNRHIPLPLGAIQNKRSLIALDNLVDLIVTCIDHPAAANQVFLAADGDDLSTTELIQKIGKAMCKPARLIPVPVGLLKLAASLLGKKEIGQRLCGSLQVDISKARELLGWEPPISVDEGLRRAVEGFRKK